MLCRTASKNGAFRSTYSGDRIQQPPP